MASGFRASVCGEKLPKRLSPALSVQVTGYSGNYYFHSLYFLFSKQLRYPDISLLTLAMNSTSLSPPE